VKLIVGLGNPGVQYEETRHNAGFWVVDALARRWNIGLNSKKFHSIIGEGHYGREKIVLAKPQTYMNLSGLAVRELVDYWQIGLEGLLVIHDDIDLPAYRIRMKRKGGSGGHRGVASIISQLHSESFARLKIGIGRPVEPIPVEDYVLSRVSVEEREAYRTVAQTCVKAVEVWLSSGIEQAMSQYNNSTDNGGHNRDQSL
jgi:PTH1 family peptidyl-tRNA hydrolase